MGVKLAGTAECLRCGWKSAGTPNRVTRDAAEHQRATGHGTSTHMTPIEPESGPAPEPERED